MTGVLYSEQNTHVSAGREMPAPASGLFTYIIHSGYNERQDAEQPIHDGEIMAEDKNGVVDKRQSGRSRKGLLLLAAGFIVVVAAGFLLLTRPAAEPVARLPEPKALLEQVIVNLRELKTFRLLIEQSGAPYIFGVTLDQGQTTVSAVMQRAEGQYENPNILYAVTRLSIGGLPPIQVEIFARGADQWFRLVSTPWINFPIAEGFDPGRLIQEDSGFPAALNGLEEITLVGAETLEDGTAVYHIRGTAAGQVVNDLMFGLLSLTQDNVKVDVYVDQAKALPALLVVTLPDTATADTPENTVWRIEVYDFNGAAQIVYPDEK